MDRKTLTDNDLDNLISIWIFACLTTNAKIAYENMAYRYTFSNGLTPQAVIQNFKEMFLDGITEVELVAIKDQWRQENPKPKEVSKLPAWLLAKGDAAARSAIIEALDNKSFFSSQIRFFGKAPASTEEVVNWGISHIERLRTEQRESKEKWLKSFKEFWAPFSSIAIASVALIISASSPYCTTSSQEKLQVSALTEGRKLKKYELEFPSKQSGYAEFIKYLNEARVNAEKKDINALSNSLKQAELTFSGLERYLKDTDSLALRKNFDTISTQSDLLAKPLPGFQDHETLQKELEGNIKNIKATLFTKLFE